MCVQWRREEIRSNLLRTSSQRGSDFLTRFIQWNYCVVIVCCMLINVPKRLVHSTTLFGCIRDVFMDFLGNFLQHN